LAPQQSPSNSGILQNGQQPPIANAGLPQTVAENSVVTLDGRASYDPDGGSIIAYQWTQIPNNGAVPVTLLGSNTATPIFRAPVVPTDTILMFSLRVVDSDGGTISTNPTIAYVLVRHGLNTAIPNIHISPFQ
jgi:chitinase